MSKVGGFFERIQKKPPTFDIKLSTIKKSKVGGFSESSPKKPPTFDLKSWGFFWEDSEKPPTFDYITHKKLGVFLNPPKNHQLLRSKVGGFCQKLGVFGSKVGGFSESPIKTPNF